MVGARFHNPEALVSGNWLEEHLSDPDVRIFDCTYHLLYGQSENYPYRYVSGRADYEAGHIPGADFLDLQGEFSAQDSPYLMTLPTAEAAAEAFARHGVADGTRVVFYTRESMQRATRFWWMLHWLGFDNAAVLDGGYDKWIADGRPVSTEPRRYPRGLFSLNPRPDVFVAKDEVLAAIGSDEICTINALGPDLHSGADASYGRPGHIPGSANVPAAALVNPETLEMLPPNDVARIFERAGVAPGNRIITYCGGGIAATLNAFLLRQLGYRNIAVYDNSMSEWATDPTLPIETN